MLEELPRRNFTDSTKRAYLRIIEEFARYFHRSPDQLGPGHIRAYIAHLFSDRKLSDNSVNQTVGALRFFFIKFLKRPWRVEETPYPKKRFRLPVILSQDEVARLIESARTPFHRTILMTLYATGVRRAELAHLQIADVDPERMVLHIRGGKGRKDRDVVLSPHLLDELRQHIGGWPANRQPGCFLEAAGTLPITLSTTRSSGGPAARPPNAPAFANRFIRTRSDTASPPTSWRPAPTCAPSRFSSATAI